MNSPRIEVDLSKVRHNARVLVELAAARGVSVTGVTKAMRGMPALAEAMLGAGVPTLGDSRVENIERLRAGGIEAPILLIRSPMPSQVARVVSAAGVSCNSDVDVVGLLSDAARAVDLVHGVVLMVELGDLREGIMPADVHDAVARCLDLPNIRIHGIGANLACHSGVVPSDRNMGVLSDLADSIEAKFDIELEVVSGGNSANFDWLHSTHHIGRINNLRLGESILLGCEPLNGAPIVGLHHDTATVFGEVIESKYKPRNAWGDRARTPFAPLLSSDDDHDHDCGSGWQAIVALGHQDTDPERAGRPRWPVHPRRKQRPPRGELRPSTRGRLRDRLPSRLLRAGPRDDRRITRLRSCARWSARERTGPRPPDKR